ncbi:MAG: hypothetical protein AAFU49_06935 [Pseudomonadota bacterium]
MKKSIKIFKLDDAWFKKEAHPGVLNEADKFFRALKSFSSADNTLNLEADDQQLSQSDLSSLKKATTLLDEVEKTGREFAAKCPSHAKSTRDGKLSEAFTVTGELIKKALPKAVQEKREEYDSYDGDGDDAPLVSPDAHKAYLKRMLPRLKRDPHNFAFALVSGEPSDQRFLFHKVKAGRSLQTAIKSDTNAKRLTFGTAAAGNLVSEERYGATTLILDLDGKPVPNLARRARLLFQSLGVATFTKIIITSNGEDVELSEDEEGDLVLTPVEPDDDDDVDVPDPSQGADEPPAPVQEPEDSQQAAPAPEPKPERKANPEEKRWRELRALLAPKVERAVELKHGVVKKTKAVWGMARTAAEKGDYAGAIKAATMLQAMLKGFEPPPEDPADKYKRQSKKLFPLLLTHAREGKGGAKALRGLYAEAETRAGNGDYEGALEMLDMLARDLARGGPEMEPVPRDGAARAALAQTLLVKSEMMERAGHELSAVFEADERETYIQELRDALVKVRTALGDPSDPGATRSFPDANAAFMVLDGLLQRAQKKGKLASQTLQELRSQVEALDSRVKALAPRVDEPALSQPFTTAAIARGQMAAAMRRKDVFGALARIEPWERAIADLEQAAAVAPEPV